MNLFAYIFISLVILFFSYKLSNKYKNNSLINFFLTIFLGIIGGIYLAIGNQYFSYLTKIGFYDTYTDYITLFMIISIIFLIVYKLAMKK